MMAQAIRGFAAERNRCRRRVAVRPRKVLVRPRFPSSNARPIGARKENTFFFLAPKESENYNRKCRETKKRNRARFAQFDNAIVIEIMSVVLTIYLVKSFEYRTMKTMVLKEVDLSMKASELMAQISSNILHCLPLHSFSFLHPPFVLGDCLNSCPHLSKINLHTCHTETPPWVPAIAISPRNCVARSHLAPCSHQILCAS